MFDLQNKASMNEGKTITIMYSLGAASQTNPGRSDFDKRENCTMDFFFFKNTSVFSSSFLFFLKNTLQIDFSVFVLAGKSHFIFLEKCGFHYGAPPPSAFLSFISTTAISVLVKKVLFSQEKTRFHPTQTKKKKKVKYVNY